MTQTQQHQVYHEHMANPLFRAKTENNRILASAKFAEKHHADPEFRARHREASARGAALAYARMMEREAEAEKAEAVEAEAVEARDAPAAAPEPKRIAKPRGAKAAAYAGSHG